jgi:hypothetical protein
VFKIVLTRILSSRVSVVETGQSKLLYVDTCMLCRCCYRYMELGGGGEEEKLLYSV